MDSSSSGGPQVAVAVRGDGRGSRRAAQWAAASLPPAAGRVVLVHVIPPLAFVPTPCKESPAFFLNGLPLSLLLDSVATDSRELMMVVCPFLAAGELVPVERMDRGTVEMYAEDRRARAQDVFLPSRRICCRRPVSSDPLLLTAAAPPILASDRHPSLANLRPQVETVVLEGNSVAEALVRYAAESGVHSLVLGSASLSWLRM
jgi:hypothetical protein